MAIATRVKVAILAGGLGTRLGEHTRRTPKPMIDVGGKPFLAHVVRSFAACGLTDFVLLTGHFGDQIEEYFGDGSAHGVRIAYSREREPIGTGGAVREARDLLGHRFVLTYGDVYRRFDYDRFVTEHRNACLAAYVTAGFSPTLRGNTNIQNGAVIAFDKRADLEYVDAGFCVVPSTVIDLLPRSGSFEETVFPHLAAAKQLEAEIVNHDFVEIGTPEALAHARAVLS